MRFEGNLKTEDIEECLRVTGNGVMWLTSQGYVIITALVRVLFLISMLIFPKQKANFCFPNSQILANRLAHGVYNF